MTVFWGPARRGPKRLLWRWLVSSRHRRCWHAPPLRHGGCQHGACTGRSAARVTAARLRHAQLAPRRRPPLSSFMATVSIPLPRGRECAQTGSDRSHGAGAVGAWHWHLPGGIEGAASVPVIAPRPGTAAFYACLATVAGSHGLAAPPVEGGGYARWIRHRRNTGEICLIGKIGSKTLTVRKA